MFVYTFQKLHIPKRLIIFCRKSFRSIIHLNQNTDTQKSILCSPKSKRLLYATFKTWNNADDLAHELIKRIVVINKYFIIIDKPPYLSSWKTSLEKNKLLSLINYQLTCPSTVSIEDCLPQLAQLVESYEKCNSQHLPALSQQSDAISKLYIVESLPTLYSGLILLARSEDYARAAYKFYKTAKAGGTPWELYQQLLCVCWNTPNRQSTNVESFPIASYAINNHISVGYRPAENEFSRHQMKKGIILTKHVHHNCLVKSDKLSSLICLKLNSVYRGLPEVYLLYEGCSVVGEVVQSSRLVLTGIAPIVLPPNQIRLHQKSSSSSADIPVHIHRSSLFIPVPIDSIPKGSKLIVKPYLKSPIVLSDIHCKTDLSNSETTDKPFYSLITDANQHFLSWSCLKLPTVKSPSRYVLTCYSSRLPDYFTATLAKLNLHFDYNSWLSQQILENNQYAN